MRKIKNSHLLLIILYILYIIFSPFLIFGLLSVAFNPDSDSVIISGLLLWIISVVIIIYVIHRFQHSLTIDLNIKFIKNLLGVVLKYLIKRYQASTAGLLPTQKQLLLVVLISGSIFILTDAISLVKFYSDYNSLWYKSSAIHYAQENFMFPHPSSFKFFTEYWHNINLYLEFKPLWHWYSDEVILTGIIFIGALLLFLISVITSKVIGEQLKNPRGDE